MHCIWAGCRTLSCSAKPSWIQCEHLSTCSLSMMLGTCTLYVEVSTYICFQYNICNFFVIKYYLAALNAIRLS